MLYENENDEMLMPINKNSTTMYARSRCYELMILWKWYNIYKYNKVRYGAARQSTMTHGLGNVLYGTARIRTSIYKI